MKPKRCSRNQIYDNPTWQTAASLKIVICNISATVINFGVIWFGDAYILSLPIWWLTKCLKIWKYKMANTGHLENRKIAISSKPFGRFWWNFPWWHILVIPSSPAVQKSNLTSGSAMAEGPRDALVSRNSATTKYPYRMALFAWLYV